jgi:hypothetical protein
MRILGAVAFVMMVLGSMGAFAQTMGGAAVQGAGTVSAQKAAQKASCERDARLIYRVGRDLSDQWQQQVKTTRRDYVQSCMAKAGFAP